MDTCNIKSCFICKRFKECYKGAKYSQIEKYLLVKYYSFNVCDKFEIIDAEYIKTKLNDFTDQD